MTHTITALFDQRQDAEIAKNRLTDAAIDADNVHIHDKSSEGYSETAHSTHDDRGIWAKIKNVFVPDEDRHTYEEGVRRGGVLLTADVDDDDVPEAVRLLEEADSVDIDERAATWRASGWDYNAQAIKAASDAYSGDVDRVVDDKPSALDPLASAPGYGRRDLDRGSARVHSYSIDPDAITKTQA